MIYTHIFDEEVDRALASFRQAASVWRQERLDVLEAAGSLLDGQVKKGPAGDWDTLRRLL